MRIGNDLDSCLCARRDVHAFWDGDRAHAKVTETLNHELLLCNDAEATSWVVANGHVYCHIGLWVTQGQLDGATADGKVGAVLRDVVKGSTGECTLLVIVKSTRGREVEIEMGKGKGQERERENSVGKHVCG